MVDIPLTIHAYCALTAFPPLPRVTLMRTRTPVLILCVQKQNQNMAQTGITRSGRGDCAHISKGQCNPFECKHECCKRNLSEEDRRQYARNLLPSPLPVGGVQAMLPPLSTHSTGSGHARCNPAGRTRNSSNSRTPCGSRDCAPGTSTRYSNPNS